MQFQLKSHAKCWTIHKTKCEKGAIREPLWNNNDNNNVRPQTNNICIHIFAQVRAPFVRPFSYAIRAHLNSAICTCESHRIAQISMRIRRRIFWIFVGCDWCFCYFHDLDELWNKTRIVAHCLYLRKWLLQYYSDCQLTVNGFHNCRWCDACWAAWSCDHQLLPAVELNVNRTYLPWKKNSSIETVNCRQYAFLILKIMSGTRPSILFRIYLWPAELVKHITLSFYTRIFFFKLKNRKFLAITTKMRGPRALSIYQFINSSIAIYLSKILQSKRTSIFHIFTRFQHI